MARRRRRQRQAFALATRELVLSPLTTESPKKKKNYDTLLYCPTSCSYRSVCGTDAACRLQF